MTNRDGHTRDFEVLYVTYVMGIYIEKHQREEEHDQCMAYMKTQMDFLTKLLLAGGTKWEKALGSLIKAIESDSKVEAST